MDYFGVSWRPDCRVGGSEKGDGGNGCGGGEVGDPGIGSNIDSASGESVGYLGERSELKVLVGNLRAGE